MMRVWLDVPYREKEQAKAQGARWDPEARRWWADGTRDTSRLSRWLAPPPPTSEGSLATVELLAVEDRCWRCDGVIASIVGGLTDPEWTLDPEGWVSIDDIAEMLWGLLDEDSYRAEWRIGPLRRVESRAARREYVANTCALCAATQGSHPLGELVAEHLADGGHYADFLSVGRVDLPVNLLPAALEERGHELGGIDETVDRGSERAGDPGFTQRFLRFFELRDY